MVLRRAPVDGRERPRRRNRWLGDQFLVLAVHDGTMRFVEVLVPTGKRGAVLELLDAEGVDYAVTPETGRPEYVAVVTFPVATDALPDVLDDLNAAGVDETAYTVVTEPETVISEKATGVDRRSGSDAISREEMAARANELAPALSTFVVMTLVSTVVATAGLFLNSSAVIIGAMIIAPVMGPAVSTAVGTVTAESALHRRGIALQLLGLLLSIGGAAVFAWMAHESFLVSPGVDVREIPAVQQRLVPDLLSLVIALGAGVAAVVSVTRDVGQALVGALIAVALIPPAATTGIMLAWNYPLSALGAFLLTVVNLLAINFVALALLWASGYRPFEADLTDVARRLTVLRIAGLVAILVVLSLILTAVSVFSYGSVAIQDQMHEEVASTLDSPEYDDVRLVETRSNDLQDALYFGETFELTVVVDAAGPRGDLAADLRDRLEARFGIPVAVEVEYVEYAPPTEDPPTIPGT